MASIATLVALPAIITANRGSSDQRPATVAAAGAPGIEAGAEIAGATGTQASSTAAAAPVPASSVTATAAANTATGVPVLQERGRATFHQYDDTVWGASSCAHGTAPLGTTITIRNLDTGQTATCVVRDRVDPATGFALDVDTEVFAQFGDLATGVAPVGISW